MVQKSIDQEKPLYALLFKSYSSQFYSKGKIKGFNSHRIGKYGKKQKKNFQSLYRIVIKKSYFSKHHRKVKSPNYQKKMIIFIQLINSLNI